MVALLAIQLALSAAPVPRHLHLLPAESLAEEVAPIHQEDRNRGSFSGGEWLAGIGSTLVLDGVGVFVSGVTIFAGILLDATQHNGEFLASLQWILYEWIAVVLLQPLFLTPLEGAIAGSNKAGSGWLALLLGYAAGAAVVGLLLYGVFVPAAAMAVLGALACHFLVVPLAISFGLHIPVGPEAAPPPAAPAASVDRSLPPLRSVPVLALAF